MTELKASQKGDGEPRPAVRQVHRTKRIHVSNVAEIGALVRLARQRLNMSQTDAAVCCGVGRRFFVELENGKPTVQLDKVLAVLDALGLTLAVGGPGAAFTAEQLANASLKNDQKEGHTWSAEFVAGLEAPYEESQRHARGRTPGSIALKYRRMSAVRDESGDLRWETPIKVNPEALKHRQADKKAK